MRLRYLDVDYYEQSARKAGSRYQAAILHVCALQLPDLKQHESIGEFVASEVLQTAAEKTLQGLTKPSKSHATEHCLQNVLPLKLEIVDFRASDLTSHHVQGNDDDDSKRFTVQPLEVVDFLDEEEPQDDVLLEIFNSHKGAVLETFSTQSVTEHFFPTKEEVPTPEFQKNVTSSSRPKIVVFPFEPPLINDEDDNMSSGWDWGPKTMTSAMDIQPVELDPSSDGNITSPEVHEQILHKVFFAKEQTTSETCSCSDDLQDVMDTKKAVKTLELPMVCEADDAFCSNWDPFSLATSLRLQPVEVEFSDTFTATSELYNKLILLPELSLVSRLFKMLAVPTICDDTVRESMFSAIASTNKQVTAASATDFLYFDWHLSQGKDCNNQQCFLRTRKLDCAPEKVPVLDLYSAASAQEDGEPIKDRGEGTGSVNEHQVNILRGDNKPLNHQETNATSKCQGARVLPNIPVSGASSQEVSRGPLSRHMPQNDGSTEYREVGSSHEDIRVSAKHQLPQNVGSSKGRRDPSFSTREMPQKGTTEGRNDPAKEFIQGPLKYRNTENPSFSAQEILRRRFKHQLPREDRSSPAQEVERLKLPQEDRSFPNDSSFSAPENLRGTLKHQNTEDRNRLNDPTCSAPEILRGQLKRPRPPQNEGATESQGVPHIPVSDMDVLRGRKYHQNEQTIGRPAEYQAARGDGGLRLTLVANIRLLDKHGLTSRRQTYQKILSLEKTGSQVVEREMRLPVDLILTPAWCLVLYSSDRLTLQHGTLIENIIENIIDIDMKAMSFCFLRCTMIFEGDLKFTSSVLQAVDDIYAAAVGLSMHVQCFVSSRIQDSDSIIFGCIKHVQDSIPPVVFPRISESETLAETFLTSFPAVNPLTAHAILSCGMSLSRFISLTHQEQVLATKSFDVPAHSLLLFKAQCEYGQKEDVHVQETKAPYGDINTRLYDGSFGPDMGIRNHEEVPSYSYQEQEGVQLQEQEQEQPYFPSIAELNEEWDSTSGENLRRSSSKYRIDDDDGVWEGRDEDRPTISNRCSNNFGYSANKPASSSVETALRSWLQTRQEKRRRSSCSSSVDDPKQEEQVHQSSVINKRRKVSFGEDSRGSCPHPPKSISVSSGKRGTPSSATGSNNSDIVSLWEKFRYKTGAVAELSLLCSKRPGPPSSSAVSFSKRKRTTL